MEIKCKMIKELPDGSAIVTIDLDDEAKDFLIGEGFLTVIKCALEMSDFETAKTHIKPKKVKKHIPKTKAKIK